MPTNLRKLPLIDVSQAKDTRGTTGQNTGYHPQSGMNCSLAVMATAQTYLIKSAMANNNDNMSAKFEEKKTAKMTINYINIGVNKELVHDSPWLEFFLTVTDPERKEQAAERKRKGLPNDDDSNKKKRKRTNKTTSNAKRQTRSEASTSSAPEEMEDIES